MSTYPSTTSLTSSTSSAYPTTTCSTSSSSSSSSIYLTTTSTTASTYPTTTIVTSTYPTTTSTTSTTSTYPATTSSKSSTTLKTTTTTSPSQCTSNAPAPTCEWGCGNWCSKPLPWWSGSSWSSAQAFCKLQVASCFVYAGWPAAAKCWDFADWCNNVSEYASKDSFLKKCPPQNPPPPPTCTPTTTSTPTSTGTVCPPTATGVCVLPTGSQGSGYENGNCVGSIKPPYVTCNDIYSEWRSNPFKLYSERNSNNCPSYPKGGVPDACKAACKIQYTACISTYAESCKSKSTGPSYGDASKQCKNQYYDCIDANEHISAGNRCNSWNLGWS